MIFNTSTILLVAICIGGAITYVIAAWQARRALAVSAKIIASTSFVALAIVNGALSSGYGRSVLAALAFSWLGDVLLLSRHPTFLLAGISSFFVAHIAFSAAFVLKLISINAFAICLILTSLLSVSILIWLWKYLHGFFRFAVPIYLLAVMLMLSLAVAASAVSLPQTVGVAALAFAVSDISVARDRFVERDVLNKAWGLPLYYFAQILFAASVGGTG
jgi:uncharacterized membrane protein YhhN